ncbi:NUDIX domain-containing protein [Streptomyces huasconensis]|uniref:NUDIX domain-containing protein n=1 Tax=Streptomyces huasconensis TaxID=1854574 RepID=UPI0034093D68
MVDDSEIVKTINKYMHGNPSAQHVLMPLYDALRDHAARRGQCSHNNRCPIVKAGALLVDERERVLALKNGTGWSFAEGEPEPGDTTLGETALRVLREHAGVYDVWTMPELEDQPLIIDVTPADPEDGPRVRVGFRYLFRAHSGALLPAMIESGRARWRPLEEVNPLIAERLQECMAVAL